MYLKIKKPKNVVKPIDNKRIYLFILIFVSVNNSHRFCVFFWVQVQMVNIKYTLMEEYSCICYPKFNLHFDEPNPWEQKSIKYFKQKRNKKENRKFKTKLKTQKLIIY